MVVVFVMQELAEFVKVITARIFCHWSCSDVQFGRFLAIAIKSHFSVDNQRSATSPHDDETSCLAATQQMFLPLVFNEMCLRPDLLGFIRWVSDAVSPSGREFFNKIGSAQDISTLCVRVIEPIASRLESLAASGSIPNSLRCAFQVLSLADGSSSAEISSRILMVVDCLVPRIVQWLYRNSTTRHFSNNVAGSNIDGGEDLLSLSEQTDMITAAQELLQMCFVNGIKSRNIRQPGIVLCLCSFSELSYFSLLVV